MIRLRALGLTCLALLVTTGCKKSPQTGRPESAEAAKPGSAAATPRNAPGALPHLRSEPSRPAQAVPAALRIAALASSQKAPGYAFAEKAGQLSARFGAADFESTATLRGQAISIAGPKGLSLQVRTARFGRKGALAEVKAPAQAKANGQELVLVRTGFEERELAGPLGLEQSFHVASRPVGAGPLELEVAFEGLVPAALDAATDRVALVDAQGKRRAVYRDLLAVDAKGGELPSHMERKSGSVVLVVDDAAASYPVTIDPLVAVQQQELLASDGAGGDYFGTSVSLSGNTALVGAEYKNSLQGAAYVFTFDGSSWTQQAELAPGDTASNGFFGASVSLSGTTALVGAFGKDSFQGAAYVFTFDGSSWSQQAKLIASDGASGDSFGTSVSLSGNTALVGAYNKTSSQGAAYVFAFDGSSWAQQAELTASDAVSGDDFGYSVSLSGNTALVGAYKKTSAQGAAYVFAFDGSSWAQQAELAASDAASGDNFGYSVSLSGNAALVGAYTKNGNQGAAYVFAFDGSAWSQQQELTATDLNFHDFGASVSLSGNTALVGAYADNSYQGAAYVFAFDGSSWSQRAKFAPSDVAYGDFFGISVSLDGNAALVGASGKNSAQGAAYAFTLVQTGAACTADADCASGFCTDGVCCDTACGGGATDDCQACSVAAGAAVDGICAAVSATHVCRASAGICDAAETCDGSSTACPADTFASSSTVCRASNGVCDVAETCTGANAACPADSFRPSSTVCRLSAGVCDTAETCTGAAAACPADSFQPSSTVCRASAGVCDAAEMCTGAAAACPGDAKLTAGTQCRASAGICDVAESCDGAANDCPADTFASASTVCRASNGVCDTAETCTGANAACPADSFQPSSTVCRASAGVCDTAETCTGAAAACPNDAKLTAGTQCRASAGICDVAESCDGSSTACPADAFKPATTECRASAGVCDPAEACTGSAAACPSDAKLAAGTQCRASVGLCDVTESCDGAANDCPSDGSAASGTACTDDSNPCTADTCDGSGTCGHPAVADGTDCGAGQVCFGGSCGTGCVIDGSFVATGKPNPANACQSCQPGTSTGAWTNLADSTACDDGNTCTTADTCQSGACTGGPARVCDDANVCTDDSCDPASGCAFIFNTTACDDANPCTEGDVCRIGTCIGTAVTFDAGDACHTAACNIQDGGALITALDGTSCDDGRSCTGADTCRNGVCIPDTSTCACGSDLDCPVIACQSASCDLASGICSYTNVSNGSTCDDGTACTQADACQDGACVGSDPITCAALDACHVAGTCIPEDGGCTDPIAADDAGCDDARTCSTGDHCSAGTCVAGDVSGCTCTVDSDCPAVGQCQQSVSCDVSSGTCVYVNLPDDAGCDDGSLCTAGEHCVSGACGAPTSTVACAALDSCHVAGTCDPATGVCSNPIATAGTACDDGRACSSNDSCQAGICAGDSAGCACSSDADCAPLDQCHVAGTCDLSTGTCSNPPKANGAVCDDQDACTSNETCESGICTAAVTLGCAQATECQDAQTCDSVSGSCVSHPLADGTGCDGGTCAAGVCVGSGGSSGTPPDKFKLNGDGCGCGAGGSDPLALSLLLGFGLFFVRRRRSA